MDQMNAPMIPEMQDATINVQNHQPQQTHQCNHQHQHQHQHHHQSYNPFANAPEEMRVFVWQSIIGGNFAFSIFMQLPMMGQGYYIYTLLINTLLLPIYKLNGLINQSLGDNILRKIFGGLAIYYFAVHGIIFYLNFESYPQYNLLLNIIYSILFVYLIVLICPPGYLKKEEFDEIIKNKPEIIKLSQHNRNICILCQIPKVVRAQHCLYCQKCVKKWETHSMTFNTCIGLYNYPFYILYTFLWAVYLLIVLKQYAHEERKQKKTFIDLIIILINLQQLYFFGQQFLLCILRVSYNATAQELGYWRRYSYLWLNERGMFGNPFDQGIIRNWISFFQPLITSKGTNNWATNKYINVSDIPNHPLSQQAQVMIDKQIQALRQQEKEMIRKQANNEEEEQLLDQE